MKKPGSVGLLWAWAYAEGRDASPFPPSKLHVRDWPAAKPDKDGRITGHPGRWARRGRPSTIGAPPFAPPFVRYLDSQRRWTPIRQALNEMRSKDKVQSLEYLVVHAIVEGGYETLTQVAVVLRAREDTVRAAAQRGLSLLFDLCEQAIANERPVTLTPPAVQAR